MGARSTVLASWSRVRLVHLALGGHGHRLRHLELRLRLLELLVGDEVRVLGPQLPRAPGRALGLVTVGLGLNGVCPCGGQHGLAAGDRGLERRRIDADQQIPALDPVALLDPQIDDPARNVGADVHLGLWFDLAAGRHGGHQVPSLDRLEPHLDARVPASAQHGGTDRHHREPDHASDDPLLP
jgi:hypothetical protein